LISHETPEVIEEDLLAVLTQKGENVGIHIKRKSASGCFSELIE
jgi:hypothetical protein